MKYLLAIVCLAVATPAVAQDNWTFTAGITNDYIARGTSQTSNQPAANLGVTYDADNWYATFWTSNVDFGDGTTQEIDFMAGYRTTVADWNVIYGFGSYNYLDDPVPYEMVEFSIKANRTFGRVTPNFTLAYSPDYFNVSGPSLWAEAGVSYALTDRWSVGGSVARQEIEQDGQSYNTFNVGTTYVLNDRVSLDLRYADTDAHDLGLLYEETFSISLNTSF